mmetsp:Transcript_8610/g.12761  ORF Transcript_8610/g.12761 Transcript_8610/m.12761 type:complete len:341 (-) Transcript_8610:210-1232(-)|eukprot:CAMPEP_0116014396 /NCGR_PEP_ID=MMETSP0321-20121206/6252_1 /TAXON_ID=163516 /ORGANISM="Leptocylindrus danicus var. danicus, Strain B650" /LENGTH=340 /DNA_ID=CAMNT_0003484039 /DNA_START=331 /DNA_END=1353 /DNA_ORIENTATION=-
MDHANADESRHLCHREDTTDTVICDAAIVAVEEQLVEQQQDQIHVDYKTLYDQLLMEHQDLQRRFDALENHQQEQQDFEEHTCTKLDSDVYAPLEIEDLEGSLHEPGIPGGKDAATALAAMDADIDAANLTLRERALWLVGLLVMQSFSGFILGNHEDLLKSHPAIIYFLTMLVGAGGNAGNQATVMVIRGLALGDINSRTRRRYICNEFKSAVALSAILGVFGCLRAAVFLTPVPETVAVTITLYIIVFISVLLGVTLPLFLQRIGVDPAHSSTTIQVVMDILGVLLTVTVCAALLESVPGKRFFHVILGEGYNVTDGSYGDEVYSNNYAERSRFLPLI